jgi:hypothetical protein
VAAVVTYSYATWTGMFPEFSGCTDAQGLGFFNRATLMFTNTQGNPAFCDGNMEALLYLLTSHVAWLNAPRDASGNPAASGQPAPSVVGRISNASEGSVSVATEWNGSGSPSQAWFLQTRYGAEFWQATAQYRAARYQARPTVVGDVAFPGPGFVRGGRW